MTDPQKKLFNTVAAGFFLCVLAAGVLYKIEAGPRAPVAQHQIVQQHTTADGRKTCLGVFTARAGGYFFESPERGCVFYWSDTNALAGSQKITMGCEDHEPCLVELLINMDPIGVLSAMPAGELREKR